MDYDYDTYENELGEYEYKEEDDGLERGDMSFYEAVHDCMHPTFIQSITFLHKLIIWNLAFRLSTQGLYIPRLLQHILSVLCGLLCLYALFPVNFPILLILPSLCYIPMRLLSSRGGLVSVLCVGFLVFCELVWLQPRAWHQIRGPQMILIMKAVSLALDLDIGLIKDVPGIPQYFGYMFCPGTCVFGPWTSYLDYERIFKFPRWRLTWLKDIVLNCFTCFIVLSISTCWVYYVFPDSRWKWVMAYRDALSFRSSHYFVSYISEMTLRLSGFTKLRQDDDIAVVRPRHVEFPRSLIQVVVSWNLPMHSWLKIYVFNTTLQFGNFFAVMVTYAASALLHGLNFQLAAVLLSLGLFSYVEYMFRKKLATTFSACIMPRPCKPDCSHNYIWKHPGVLGVNFCFLVLNLLHLAYLGVVFNDTEASNTGFNYQHTLAEWSKLGYLSHYIAVFTFIFYYLI